MLLIALVISAELALAFALLSLWLGVRLKRSTGHASPTAHDYIADELTALNTRSDKITEEQQTMLDVRRHALQAELAVLEAPIGEPRQKALMAYQALTERETAQDTDEESERLRRLLRREGERLGELLGMRDEMRELRVGYDRVRRLAAQLLEAYAAQAPDDKLARIYRETENSWLDALEQLEQRLCDCADEQATMSSNDTSMPGDDLDTPEHGGTVEEYEQALAMKDKEIEQLRTIIAELRPSTATR